MSADELVGKWADVLADVMAVLRGAQLAGRKDDCLAETLVREKSRR